MELSKKNTIVLSGKITPPASKSYSQRALLATLLIDTKVKIVGIGASKDEIVVSQIVANLKKLNFDFDQNIMINCGESGLCARLCAMLFMLNKKNTTIQGGGTLLARPMTPIQEVYNQLDIEYQWKQGKLPITLKGNRKEKSIEIDGGLSSQFISGLLYYFVGLQSKNAVHIKIKNLTSKPYIDMTIEILAQIGANIDWKEDAVLEIQPSQLVNPPIIQVEKDWSSAAVWIVAAAIGGDISLSGLNRNSLQADRVVVDIVSEFGAEVIWKNKILRVRKKNNRPINIDATHSPDLIPILTILAMFAKGTSSISGIHRLENKESNRKLAIETELAKLYDGITVEQDSFVIQGIDTYQKCKAIEMKTYQDHRLVMAWSILDIFVDGEIILDHTEVVDKSYPDFFQDMEKVKIIDI